MNLIKLILTVFVFSYILCGPCGAAGAFSIAPNSSWYQNEDGNDVTSGSKGSYYEYNAYIIRFSAEPCEATITWNGSQIGITPFKYAFTGKLFTDEDLSIIATPQDPKYTPRKARISLYTALPRIIHFDFTKD